MIRGDGAGRQDEITAPFVERRTYRRRRLMDIARLLPILGAVLFAVPLMWPDPDPYPAPGSQGGMRMSSAITYVFLVWAGLIAISLAFAEAVRHWAEHCLLMHWVTANIAFSFLQHKLFEFIAHGSNDNYSFRCYTNLASIIKS